jgi:hypothetical protein
MYKYSCLCVTTGIQYFAVFPNLCRVQNFGHTATSPFAVSQKKNTRQTKGTRQTFAVCLEKKRTAKIKHTANGGSLPCAMTNTRQPGLFAVCLTFGTRQTCGPGEPFVWLLGLLCASTGTRQSKSIPCVFILCCVPKLWHTANCLKKLIKHS